MTSLLEKRDLILENETRFAGLLAREVLTTPKMNMWMILIPFIFIYQILQYRRVAEGRKVFIRSYLRSRERALAESLRCAERSIEPEIEVMPLGGDLPESARNSFREFFFLLVSHYTDLLRSEGADMESLIRSAYRNRMNYLLFLQRLNQAEGILNDALRPHIAGGAGIDEVLQAMKTVSERLRREYASVLFP